MNQPGITETPNDPFDSTNGVLLTELTDLGLLKVSGADAQKFLQGQLTSDVREVTVQQHQLSAWCTAKGRILTNFRLFKHADAYYWLMPRIQIPTLLERLRKYVLRAKVTLFDASDMFIPIGIAGAHSQALLSQSIPLPIPTDPNQSVSNEQLTILCIPGRQRRYIVVGEIEVMQRLRQSWGETATTIDLTQWQLLDILAGLPQVVPATSEAFVPQMINLHKLGGVSFKKGCYTGQEIVARLQYLGTLKRRLYLVKIDSTRAPQPGEELYVSDNEQSVGQIVNAQLHPEGYYVALAVIQVTQADKAAIHLATPHTPQGALLQLLTLPYSIDEI